MLSSKSSSTPPVTWRLPKSRSARKFSQCPLNNSSPGNHFRPTSPKHKPKGFERPLALVGLSQRSLLETPQRRRIVDQEPHGSPGCLRERGRRQSLCRVGGKRLLPKRNGKWPPAAKRRAKCSFGRRIKTKRQMDGELFRGRFPAKHCSGRLSVYGPGGSFPPNEYGLHDMAGSVRNCSDFYHPAYYKQFLQDPHSNPNPNRRSRRSAGAISAPTGTCPLPQAGVSELMFLHVTKGGSFLCHFDYCLRYRPAARHHSESAPSNHTGFRCVKDADQEDLKL